MDYAKIARRYLDLERKRIKDSNPKSNGIILSWREGLYVGSLQKIAPDYSKEIVLLSKTSSPLQRMLIDAIKIFEPDRQTIKADSSLNLEGRQHVLRINGSNLTHITSKQTEYILSNSPKIYEI